jgi:hypothetical protein
MQKQVHMGINQSRQQSVVTEIDGFHACGVGHLCADFDDPLTLHQHFARFHDAPAFDVEQACGVKHDGVRGRCLSAGDGRTNQENCDQGRERACVFHIVGRMVPLGEAARMRILAEGKDPACPSECSEESFLRRLFLSVCGQPEGPARQ